MIHITNNEYTFLEFSISLKKKKNPIKLISSFNAFANTTSDGSDKRDITMEKLLHWSIANANGDKEAIEKAGQPDPKLLQQLFGGGPDEPALMKQAILVITNPEAELENKLIAFDNFEMLIENLDNANNIENLKLWEPLISVLKSDEEELRAFALSVIGTAVQNNTKSQENFLKYEDGLPGVIEIAGNTKEVPAVRTKAFYALSNLIRHNSDVYEKFVSLGGLEIIPPVLGDETSNDKLKMRVLALLAAVLTAVEFNASFVEVLRKDGIIESTLDFLVPDGGLYVIDRVLNFLSQLISFGFKFNEQEMSKLRQGYENIENLKDRLNEDDYQTVRQVL